MSPDAKTEIKSNARLPIPAEHTDIITPAQITQWLENPNSYSVWLNGTPTLTNRLDRLAKTLQAINTGWTELLKQHDLQRLVAFLRHIILLNTHNLKGMSAKPANIELMQQRNELTHIFITTLHQIFKNHINVKKDEKASKDKRVVDYAIDDWLTNLLAAKISVNISSMVELLQVLILDPIQLTKAIAGLGRLAAAKQSSITNPNFKWLYNLWPENLNKENTNATTAADYFCGLSLLVIHHKKSPALKAVIVNDLFLHAIGDGTSAEKIAREMMPNLLDLICTLGIDDPTTLSVIPLEQCLNKIVASADFDSGLFIETLQNTANIIYWINRPTKPPQKISIPTLTRCLEYLSARPARFDDTSIANALLSIAQIVHTGMCTKAEKAQLHAAIQPLIKRLNSNAATMHPGDIAHTLQAAMLLNYFSHADTKNLVTTFERKWLAYCEKPENKQSQKLDKISHLQQVAEYLYASGIIPPTQDAPPWIKDSLLAVKHEPKKNSFHEKVMQALVPLFSDPKFKKRYTVIAEKIVVIRPLDIGVVDNETGEIHGFQLDGEQHFTFEGVLHPEEIESDERSLKLEKNGKRVLKGITRYRIAFERSPTDIAKDIVARVTQPSKVEAKVEAKAEPPLADEAKKKPAVKAAAVAPAAQPKKVKKKDSKVQPRAQVSEQNPWDDLTDAMRHNNTIAAEQTLRKLLEKADQKDTAKAHCLLTLLEIGHSNTPNLLSPSSPLIIKLLPLFSRTAISCPISDEAEALSPLTWAAKNNYPKLIEEFIKKAQPQKKSGKKAKRKEKTPTENWWNAEWTKAWKMAKEMENPTVFEQLQTAAKQAGVNLEEPPKPKQEIKSAPEVKIVSAPLSSASSAAPQIEEKKSLGEAPDENSHSDLQVQENLMEEMIVRETDPESEAIYFVSIEQLAEAGLGKAQFAMAKRYINTKNNTYTDPEKFLYWMHLAAKNGVKEAQGILGILYSDMSSDSPVEKDPTKSLSWFLKAAEGQNNINGIKWIQNRIGNCYRIGKGTERNQEEAIKWWKLAAQEPDPDKKAEFGLGLLYYLEKKDFKQSIHWLKRAVREPGGVKEAIAPLSDAYWLDNNFDEGFPWFKRAAEEADSSNIEKYRLGFCLSEGKGTSKNKQEAFRWFQQAADGPNGLKLAQHRVALCCLKGEGTAMDAEQAKIWLGRAAQNPGGLEESASILRTLNSEGLKKTQLRRGNAYLQSHNEAEAREWFTLAAQGPGGLEEAQMAIYDLDGELEEKSPEMSRLWAIVSAGDIPVQGSAIPTQTAGGYAKPPAISHALGAIKDSPAHAGVVPKSDAKKKADAKKSKTVVGAALSH